MTESNWGERIFHLLTPIVVFFGITYLAELFAGMYWTFTYGNEYFSDVETIDVTAFQTAMAEFLAKYYVLCETAGGIVSLFFLGRMYMKDILKRRFQFDTKNVRNFNYILVVIAAVFLSLSGNFLINITDWSTSDSLFVETESILFSGSYIVQVIGIGFVIPACEELVYRGLVHMRLRQYMDVNRSIVISALIFASMHGNIVQGIYSFIAGILFAYLFEKFGSLKASIIAHISANLFSLMLEFMNVQIDRVQVIAFIGGAAAVVTLLVVILIDRNVQAEYVYPDEISGYEEEPSH